MGKNFIYPLLSTTLIMSLLKIPGIYVYFFKKLIEPFDYNIGDWVLGPILESKQGVIFLLQ